MGCRFYLAGLRDRERVACVVDELNPTIPGFSSSPTKVTKASNGVMDKSLTKKTETFKNTHIQKAFNSL